MTGRSRWYLEAALVWFALLTALAGAVGNVAEILIIDFVHGNPHRTQENALEMMVFFTPMMGLLALVLALLTYSIPQLFQAVVSETFAVCCGTPIYVAVLLALPLTALVTFYSLFYVTVPLFDTFGADKDLYPNELTVVNYLVALSIQAPATIFAAAYAGVMRERLRWKIVIGSAVGAGVFWGSHLASGQSKFF
jgi:hypothetical protein